MCLCWRPEAEGEGFEPSVQGLPTQRFSRPPDSTTLAPLRGRARGAAERLARLGLSGARRRTPSSSAAHSRRQQAAGDLRAVVEARLGEHVEHAAGRAGLRVGGAVDHARHAAEHDRAGAHRARLERHVEHGRPSSRQEPRARAASRRASISACARRVLAQLALVVARADHLAARAPSPRRPARRRARARARPRGSRAA